ncbi:MAG TPA: glycosyltransferase family 39 protein [Gemmataceae bacterium]
MSANPAAAAGRSARWTDRLPRHLPAWLPFLWSRVLFPGRADGTRRVRLLSLVLLAALPAALLYPSRSYLLLEPDEGRYAQIPREMLAAGDAVVPTLQGEPYLDKPPLFYWLVMLSYAVFGVTDAAARLVPAVAVHATVLAVYLIGRRSLGERSAFWGALLLSLTPGFVGMGRLLILDGLLTFCVTLMLLAAFEAVRGEKLARGWWLLAAAACGFGVLTKGPVALILLLPPLLAYRWLTGGGTTVGRRAWAAFALVVAVINAPWYVAIYLREPVFLRYFFWEHNVLRFLQPFDHLQPVWYYVPVFLAGMLPGTLLLPAFARHLLTGDDAEAAKRSPELSFWLLAGGWCLLFFSVSGSKLPTYILPAFPPLALALGNFIAGSRWSRSAWAPAVLASSGLAMAGAFYLAVPWYAERRSPVGRPELVAPYVADPRETVVCYPRHCDSVAFYFGRDDLINYRSKETHLLVQSLLARPRTIILLTHRHSLEALRQALPEGLQISESVSLRHEPSGWPLLDRLAGDTPWGLCDIAVVEITVLADWKKRRG